MIFGKDSLVHHLEERAGRYRRLLMAPSRHADGAASRLLLTQSGIGPSELVPPALGISLAQIKGEGAIST